MDKQGNVHFSDQPQEGAVKLDIPDAKPPSPEQKAAPTSEQAKPLSTTSSGPRAYKSIAIVQPENDATIRNTDGIVAVAVDLHPAIVKGDRVQLLYDGKKMGDPQATTTFSLSGVLRGSHTVSVQIVDGSGKEIGHSNTITINMMPPRVNMIKK